MNCLLLDMGNTRLKWASLEAEHLKPGQALAYREQELVELLDHNWSGLSAPERVLAVCVAEQAIRQQLAAWVSQHWRREIVFLQSPAQGHGVINSYVQPQRLGSDRWAALVAARSLGAAPTCVVNCGSAVTIDVLDKYGRHQGGLILPGLGLMQVALAEHTSLPEIDRNLTQQFDTLATQTEQAIYAGTLTAITGAIEKTMHIMQDKLHASLTCFLAGGDAQRVSQHLTVHHEVRPDLVLQGLAIIARST